MKHPANAFRFRAGAARRLELILNLLEARLDVDVYGSCALWPIKGGWVDLPREVVQYKFFMSFENSFHCRDYVTEKTWWNALRSGVVPVIWGPAREDVKALLPENSFVFVEDFATPQALVDHLRYLDEHLEEYSKFFTWRKKLPLASEGKVGRAERKGFCQLCRILHDDSAFEKTNGKITPHVLPSLYDWWYNQENYLCLSSRSYAEVVLGYCRLPFFIGELYFKALSWKRFYIITSIVFLTLVIYRKRYRRERA